MITLSPVTCSNNIWNIYLEFIYILGNYSLSGLRFMRYFGFIFDSSESSYKTNRIKIQCSRKFLYMLPGAFEIKELFLSEWMGDQAAIASTWRMTITTLPWISTTLGSSIKMGCICGLAGCKRTRPFSR
jgi:hypothetical protein